MNRIKETEEEIKQWRQMLQRAYDRMITVATKVDVQTGHVECVTKYVVPNSALRNYARSRAIGHSLTANTISRPAVVQAPF